MLSETISIHIVTKNNIENHGYFYCGMFEHFSLINYLFNRYISLGIKKDLNKLPANVIKTNLK